MGADQSKALSQWTADDTVAAVASLGHQYSKYEGTIREKNVNGSLLSKLSEGEIDGALEGLGVSSRLHRRVLVKKILSVQKQEKAAPKPVLIQAPFRRQGSLTPDQKAQLWKKLQASAEQQRKDHENLVRQEATLRSQIAAALGA